MATKSTDIAVGATVPTIPATAAAPVPTQAQAVVASPASVAAPTNTTAPLPATLVQPATVPTNPAAAPSDRINAAEPSRAEDGIPQAGTTVTLPASRPAPPPATVLPLDEYHGKGGDYVIGEDGIRRPAVPAA